MRNFNRFFTILLAKEIETLDKRDDRSVVSDIAFLCKMLFIVDHHFFYFYWCCVFADVFPSLTRHQCLTHYHTINVSLLQGCCVFCETVLVLRSMIIK